MTEEEKAWEWVRDNINDPKMLHRIRYDRCDDFRGSFRRGER